MGESANPCHIMAAAIRIGTSGWHYKDWIGRYYPNDIHPSEMLAYYTRDFECGGAEQQLLPAADRGGLRVVA